MKNLKFRAWDKEDKRMKEVFNLDFHRYTAIVGFRLSEPKSFLIDEPLIIMQSTGLKDKNGVEIFEGDVVKITDESWGADFIVSNVIWFGDTEWQYPAFDLNGLYIPKDFHFEANALNTCILENEVEIIGNQFEHPNLLEE